MNSKITTASAWKDPNSFQKTLLTHPWYRIMPKLQNEFARATVDFFSGQDLQFVFLPVTTNSISSPMGLGSDSLPVRVEVDGKETFLADSAQFYLELACRVRKEGTYYIAPSFRGESSDARHLKQFFHSEAEIVGNLEDVMVICEKYITHLVKHYLSTSVEEITSIAGSTKHLEVILDLKKIPKISFQDAYKRLSDNPEFYSLNGEIRTITPQGEKRLLELFGNAVWLTNFDHLSVPFYQAYADEQKLFAKNPFQKLE